MSSPTAFVGETRLGGRIEPDEPVAFLPQAVAEDEADQIMTCPCCDRLVVAGAQRGGGAVGAGVGVEACVRQVGHGNHRMCVRLSIPPRAAGKYVQAALAGGVPCVELHEVLGHQGRLTLTRLDREALGAASCCTYDTVGINKPTALPS